MVRCGVGKFDITEGDMCSTKFPRPLNLIWRQWCVSWEKHIPLQSRPTPYIPYHTSSHHTTPLAYPTPPHYITPCLIHTPSYSTPPHHTIPPQRDTRLPLFKTADDITAHVSRAHQTIPNMTSYRHSFLLHITNVCLPTNEPLATVTTWAPIHQADTSNTPPSRRQPRHILQHTRQHIHHSWYIYVWVSGHFFYRYWLFYLFFLVIFFSALELLAIFCCK